MDEGLEQPGEQTLRLSDFLRAAKEPILEQWVRAVRQLPRGRSLPRAALGNHIPRLLERIADGLRAVETGRPVQMSELPRLYALQRMELGFDLSEVVQELSAFRESILRLWQSHAGGESAAALIGETRALCRAIDTAIAVAFITYAQSRERTLLELASERQRALDALEEGEPFALLDAEWRVVLVNKGQERVSRMPREQTLGKVLWELWPDMKDPGTKYWTEYHRCMVERVPVVFEDYLPSLGVWTEVSAYPARDGGIALFFRDVTARKQAHEALRHSEAQYRLLFDSMNEGFAVCEIILDAEGRPHDYRHLLVNQAFTRLSGGRFTPEFAKGKTARELAPDVEEYWIELFGKVALTGEPASREDYVAALDRWFDTRAYSLGGGRFAYLYEDVTLTKRAERVMREANARLVEADRRKDELIGILSHDLRNPLGVVKLAAGALLKREGLDERTLKGLVRIQSSTERCMQLIETLLDFTHARLGTGIPVRTEPVHLGQLALHVVEEAQALYPERELRTECRGSGTVEADPLRLGQVLQNLVQNALKYSPPGTPVTVRILSAPRSATLQVHNLGTPIPEALLPRLFEPMLRGTQEDARGERSLGLGLYIVDQIVRAHGGAITVKSGEEGTTFTVQLPRAQKARPDV
jgi:signal transduction histidine kinase